MADSPGGVLYHGADIRALVWLADLIPCCRVGRFMKIEHGLDPTRRLLVPLPDRMRADPRNRTAVGPGEAVALRST